METVSFYICFFGIFLSFKSIMAYEEPDYKIVHHTKNFEIRFYEKRIVAQTKFDRENSGFMKLFNYISGSNYHSEKIKMTTPITLLKDREDTFMQFSLPSKFNSTNTPSPNDKSVEISYIDEGHFAVLRYSGRTTVKNFHKNANILLKELEKKNILTISPPIKAIYDGPFTIPLFRRNEVMFLVEWN